MESTIAINQASERVKSKQQDIARQWPNNAKSKTKRNGTHVLDARALLDLAVTRDCVEYKSRQAVFTQGDPATSALHIQESGVKVSVVNEIVACLCGFLLAAERFARSQGNT
jgi:hypothetical protein